MRGRAEPRGGRAQGGQAMQGRRLLAPSASSAAGLVDISAGGINYTVGGSQHVAVNLTVAAASTDLANITAALRDYVTGGLLAQRLVATGAAPAAPHPRRPLRMPSGRSLAARRAGACAAAGVGVALGQATPGAAAARGSPWRPPGRVRAPAWAAAWGAAELARGSRAPGSTWKWRRTVSGRGPALAGLGRPCCFGADRGRKPWQGWRWRRWRWC